MADLASIISSSNAQDADIHAVISQILGSNAQVQQASQDEVDNTTTMAEDARVSTQQQESGALSAQENSRTAATSLGTNMDSTTQVITDLGSKLVDAYSAANVTAQKMADRATQAEQSGSFFGRVIAKARNRADAPILEAQVNNAMLLSKELNDLNSTTQNIAKTQADIAPTKTVATVAAATDFASRAIANRANQTKIQAAQYNIAAVRDVASLGQEALGNKISVANLQESMAQRALSFEGLKLQIQERADRIAQNKENEQGMEDYANYVRTGLAYLSGGPAPNLPSREILQLSKLDLPLYKQAAAIGMQMVGSGGNAPMLGATPGEAASIVVKTRVPLSPDMAKVRALLVGAYGKATNTPNIDKKDMLQVQDATSAIATMEATAYQKEIKPNDYANPYTAPNVRSVLELPGMKGNVFAEKVLAPYAGKSNVETDPDQIVKLAIQNVQNKNLSFSDAVSGLNLFFNAAVKLNNSMKQFDRVGLPPQASFNAPISTSAGFTRTVDLTNSAQITNILSSALLRDTSPATSVMGDTFYGR